MTVLDHDFLKALTLSTVGNDNRNVTTSLLSVCKYPGGTLLIAKIPDPGTHRKTNARGFPGGGECSRLELTHT